MPGGFFNTAEIGKNRVITLKVEALGSIAFDDFGLTVSALPVWLDPSRANRDGVSISINKDDPTVHTKTMEDEYNYVVIGCWGLTKDQIQQLA